MLPGDYADHDETANPGRPRCPEMASTTTAMVRSTAAPDFDGDGYTEDAGDCAPADATVYPMAQELRRHRQQLSVADEGTVLFDDDGDGWCEGLPAGGTPCTDGNQVGDCNDNDVTTFQDAPELEDWRDNDCDSTVDEGTNNYDDDGDGYTENATPADCDDTRADVGPATLEVPGNGIDDDCNPATPATGLQ